MKTFTIKGMRQSKRSGRRVAADFTLSIQPYDKDDDGEMVVFGEVHLYMGNLLAALKPTAEWFKLDETETEVFYVRHRDLQVELHKLGYSR